MKDWTATNMGLSKATLKEAIASWLLKLGEVARMRCTRSAATPAPGRETIEPRPSSDVRRRILSKLADRFSGHEPPVFTATAEGTQSAGDPQSAGFSAMQKPQNERNNHEHNDDPIHSYAKTGARFQP